MANDGESIPLLVVDGESDDCSKDVTLPAGASAEQTAINISKMCAGTGTLALPFAAEQGGLAFHLVGLFLIAAWDYKGSTYLLRSHAIIQATINNQIYDGKEYGNTSGSDSKKRLPPPDGTTMYGTVAWYAAGPTGRLSRPLYDCDGFQRSYFSFETHCRTQGIRSAHVELVSWASHLI